MCNSKRFSFVLVCLAAGYAGACGDGDPDGPPHSGDTAGVAGTSTGGSQGTGGKHTGGSHTGGGGTGGASAGAGGDTSDGGTSGAGGGATGGQSEGGAAGQPTSTGGQPEGGAAGGPGSTAGSAEQGGNSGQAQGGTAGQEFPGSAGQAGQGGATLGVPEACAIQCQAQQDVTIGAAGAGGSGDSCYDAANCEFYCTDPLDPGSSDQTSCKPEYTAMVLCQAELNAEQWYCGLYDVGVYMPAPVAATDCEEEVCAWTCCDQSYLTMADLVDRCECE